MYNPHSHYAFMAAGRKDREEGGEKSFTYSCKTCGTFRTLMPYRASGRQKMRRLYGGRSSCDYVLVQYKYNAHHQICVHDQVPHFLRTHPPLHTFITARLHHPHEFKNIPRPDPNANPDKCWLELRFIIRTKVYG